MGRAYNLRNTPARKSKTDPDSRKRQSRQSNKKGQQKETNAGERMEASSNSEEIRKKGNEAFKKFKYCAQRPIQKGFLTEAIGFYETALNMAGEDPKDKSSAAKNLVSLLIYSISKLRYTCTI